MVILTTSVGLGWLVLRIPREFQPQGDTASQTRGASAVDSSTTQTHLASQEALTTHSSSHLPASMQPFVAALGGVRDPVRGASVFTNNCRSCHRIGIDGHQVGPDLAKVIGQTDEEILVDILEPSRKIDLPYRTCIVVTKKGYIHTGILANESEGCVTLRRENGLNQLVFRPEIEEMTLSDVSLMPANLGTQLTPQEVADLIAYLRQASDMERQRNPS